MLGRGHIHPGIATTLLIALAAAIVPGARWCVLRWDQVDTQAFLACQAASHLSIASCAMVRALVEHPGEIMRHGGESPHQACAASNSCPLQSHSRCPESFPGPAPPASSRGHGRAYCLDEPGMATGVRAAAPGPDRALAQASIVAILAALPPAPAVEHIFPESEPRPPTPPLAARPPIRGPPEAPRELA